MTVKSTLRGGVGQGSDDNDIKPASLSHGSDTLHLERVYVIVDPEVERNGSLTMDILLVQEIAEAVTLVLEEKIVGRRVLFTMFFRGISWPRNKHSRT
jgi:hypothetical protein